MRIMKSFGLEQLGTRVEEKYGAKFMSVCRRCFFAFITLRLAISLEIIQITLSEDEAEF